MSNNVVEIKSWMVYSINGIVFANKNSVVGNLRYFHQVILTRDKDEIFAYKIQLNTDFFSNVWIPDSIDLDLIDEMRKVRC